jgi:hypothetical protein
MRTLHRSLAGVAAALLLAACGGDREAAGTASDTAVGTVPPAAAPTTAAAGDLRVTEVDLGRAMVGDTAVIEDTDDFAPTDTIHAVVRHEGAAESATITARWTFQDGQVVDERTETVTGTGTTAAYTHFMITKPTAWPAGRYTLHVLVNGAEVESEEFEVK